LGFALGNTVPSAAVEGSGPPTSISLAGILVSSPLTISQAEWMWEYESNKRKLRGSRSILYSSEVA
jgi:hypothetical protein